MTPDIAVIMLGAGATHTSLAEAMADVSRRMASVLAKVRSLGIADEDLTTISYSVSLPTEGARRDPTSATVVYEVTHIVQIKIRKVEEVGVVVDAAVAAGANRIRDVYLTVDDPSAPQAQARAIAVRNAMDRARGTAKAAGVRLGAIVAIRDIALETPPLPQPAAPPVGGPAPTRSDRLEVKATVELRYAIRRLPPEPIYRILPPMP